MIFKQWQKVLSGEKTQTRRPVREGEYFLNGRVKKAGRAKWIEGKTYAVQPKRCARAVGRIKILRIERAPLLYDCISFFAEGMSSAGEFWNVWQSMYGGTEFDARKNPDVWVISFKAVE
jgi:hypothetical protein